jgi:hypothetical protein
MTSPSHETLRAQLLDLAYGELPRRQADALRRHLEGCAACRAELARLEGTRALMAGLAPEPAPPEGERILLAAARQAVEGRRPARRLAWLWGAPVGAVAAVLVAAVSYRLVTSSGLPPPETEGALRVPAPAAAGAAPAPSRPDGVVAPRPGGGGTQEPERAGAARPRSTEREASRSREEGRRGDDAQAFAEPPPARAERKAAAPAPSAPPLPADRGDDALALGEATGGAAPSPRASEPLAAPPPPAAKRDAEVGRQALAEAPASAKVAAPRAAAAPAASAPAAADAGSPREDVVVRHRRLELAGGLQVSTAAFPGCVGESWREVAVDAGGQVVRYVRRGVRGGAPYEAQLYYGEDGALGAVRYAAGGRVREVRLGPASGAMDAEGIPPAALEPRRAADAALGAPPRCEG